LIGIIPFIRESVLLGKVNSSPYFSMPILPVPLHFGQVTMPNLLGLVTHALGLAMKGSSLGTFPFPLQTGHIANIAIP